MDRLVGDVSCSDKICIEEQSFQQSCDVYVGDAPFCDPPCFTENCTIEIRENVLCTYWQCLPISTTTFPTTTVMPGPNPDPEKHFNALTIGLISSALLNVILILIAIVIAIRYRQLLQHPPLPLNDEQQRHDQQEGSPALMVPANEDSVQIR